MFVEEVIIQSKIFTFLISNLSILNKIREGYNIIQHYSFFNACGH